MSRVTPGPYELARYASQLEAERDTEKLRADSLQRLQGVTQAKLERARSALQYIGEMQPKVLAMIQANGFVWDDRDSIGNEPGNWQHLAFTLYSTICEIDSIAHAAEGSP